MTLRTALVVAIVLATVLFAVGVGSEPSHAEHAGEAAEHVEHTEHATVFGVDIEATPFVVLAAAGSVALAAAAWLRPHSRPLLALVALAMLGFAALDVREATQQDDAALAALVAALHLAAAAIAATMLARAAPGPAARPSPASRPR